MTPPPTGPAIPTTSALGRLHARRLRDVHRSAGWPCHDSLEVELLAAGLLQRHAGAGGQEHLRLTDAGIAQLAAAFARNRQALSRHDALVDCVARMLQREGRLVWTQLSVRARLPDLASGPVDIAAAAVGAGTPLLPAEGLDAAPLPPRARWKICRPDVFSIRNSSVPGYLEPMVHEIKVSRADLLGDLRAPDKRDSYLDVGGQCWYVLGCDAHGRPIADAEEIPAACGVLVAQPDGRLEVARHAPRRASPDLPFALWMALAKATPLPPVDDASEWGPDQAPLRDLLDPSA